MARLAIYTAFFLVALIYLRRRNAAGLPLPARRTLLWLAALVLALSLLVQAVWQR
jgi:hypothetical protein